MNTLPINLMQIQFNTLSGLQKYELSQRLAKREDFFITYFNNLPYSDTNKACFDKLNELHFLMFKKYMYSDINSFKNQFSKGFNKK